ncbi:MAG: preprotein translocase subunit YajC [Planctomyces sp.]|nr:preprotein translocase subunit YajC [Planctomyces sp.]
MINILTDLLLFAQEEGADAAAQKPPANGMDSLVNLLPLIAIVLFFWFFMLRPHRQAEKKHQALVSSLKKNDKVETIGGIIGTVTHMTDDEVTLKVDDNTKLRFRRSSIRTVLTAPEEKS